MAAPKSAARKRLEFIGWKAFQRADKAKDWVIGQIVRGALNTLRRLPPDRALNFADRFARRYGPLFGRHRTALSNLRKAYPEKPEAEIEALALGMWGNMGRLAAEYVFLDALFDFDPAKPNAGRVEVSGAEVFLRIAAEKRPHIIFTAHLGCFEMLPVAAATLGLNITALFRPPNNPYIAEYVFSSRRVTMGDLLASRAGAAFALSRVLENGGNVGMLVDQRFRGGADTEFFGRGCQTSPLLPKLVRYHECDVYPARCIRLPHNRYRLEIEERLELPRTEAGSLDINASAQLLNDVVERWVREHPDQWMWFHRRWGGTGKRARWSLDKRQMRRSR